MKKLSPSVRSYAIGYILLFAAYAVIAWATSPWGNDHPVLAAHLGVLFVLIAFAPLLAIPRHCRQCGPSAKK
jgi:hypothetical protein